jgi:hypothetical protein
METWRALEDLPEFAQVVGDITLEHIDSANAADEAADSIRELSRTLVAERDSLKDKCQRLIHCANMASEKYAAKEK